MVLAAALSAQAGHPAVNADSVLVQDFEKRVDRYLQLRKSIESKLTQLKTTDSPDKISQHEDALGRAVREARKGARQGDVFSAEISTEIRRLITIAMQPRDSEHIRQSLRHSEPVQLNLNVNDSYPARMPLQSTPPSLLGNLPSLPPEIEYRITGRDLVLLDAKANLVIDVIPGVFS
jgi:hypothetical protein